MQSIEEIEAYEMEQLKPDYNHYRRFDSLTVAEFALLIHGIDPSFYSELALSKALMFIKTDRDFLEPASLPYTPSLFQKTLITAKKTYDLLSRVEWNIKYGSKDTLYLNKIPMKWLISEAIEKKLKIPVEFMKFIENTLTTSPQKIILHKQKQKRTHALHEVIKETHCESEDKSAETIWKKLKKLADTGNHEILQGVDSWTFRDASIKCISNRNNERSMRRSTFENFISKLNNQK